MKQNDNLMKNKQSENFQYSFEEFKLIYESAEKVTDRRLNKNSQNYSISVGIILAIAVIANWSLSNPLYRYIGFTLIVTISFLSTIYVKLWLRQILDFKALNTAKFEVLNNMSPLLKFDSNNENIIVVSYEPFKREWESMQRLEALQTTKKKRLVALKSTNEELFVPNAFFVIFIITTIVPILAICFRFSDFISNWKTLLFGQ